MTRSIHLIKFLIWIFISIMIFIPNNVIYAQDVDEDGEMFWEDDEEYEDNEEYEDDEEYELSLIHI